MTQTVELTLNPEIVSVDGVVNGESYAFTLTGSVDGMSVWSTDVPESEDHVYRVEVTATSQTGVTSTMSTILYYGLHLITDRTQFDVDRVNSLATKGLANMSAAEREEWSAGLKGAYNSTDLNRVQSAARYVQERLRTVGYNVTLSNLKTWTPQDFPTKQDMDNYLNDIRAIRSVLAVMSTTPAVPDSMVNLTYVKANAIEQILMDVDTLLANMISSFVYAGDIYGGEV